MKRLLILLGILLLVSVVSADYALQVQTLTNSPGDGATNYFGNRPESPTATVNISQIYIPTSGVINVAEIYDYSGTAGTNEAYSYYIRKNNATDYLISTLTLNTNERVFTNSSMGIPVSVGDFFEIKRVHPTWATNPLTNIVGGYVLVNTSWTQPGYPLYGMALTNTVADTTTDYLGGRPIAPSTTEGTNKIFAPTNGTITRAYVNDYSGTAGTAEAYSYYINVNNTASLIQTQSVSSNQRLFQNTNVGAGILKGNYLEFKRGHPLWVTNPATNTVGATAFVDTSEEHIDGYPIWVEALTSSPTDAQTVYFGNRPIVPSTTTATNKIYIRQNGTITRSEIYVYSGTAGSATGTWNLSVRLNNATDYLISDVNISASERIFRNTSMGIPVVAGDYIEIKGVQPTWTTNPLTTVYGGYVFLEYENQKPVVSFTSNTIIGINPLSVQFNDTSVTGITAWNWSHTNIGNGTKTYWSTIQNATHTFDEGVWQINLEATNASGSRVSTNTYHITSSPSGIYSGFNRQDIMMDQIYTFTLNVKDSTTLFGIPGASVLTSTGDNTTTDVLGQASFTMNYTALVVQVGATGYGSRAVSYVVDRDRTETIYLTPTSTAVNGTPLTFYSPWQVRIRIADFNGNPLPGTNVTASYVASTLPSTSISWLVNAFGINPDVANEMVDSGVAMGGITDSNGGLSFTMFKSIMYSLAITNTTAGISSTKTLYPSDQEYLIRVALPGQVAYNNTLSQMANTSLPVYQLNATAYNLSVIYQDTSGLTTNVQFQVKWRNGTYLWNESLGNPGTGVVVGNFTIINPGIGKEVIWLYNATRSGT